MFASVSSYMEPFDCDDSRNIDNRWQEWVTRLEHLFGVSKVNDENQKLNGLFFYGGKRLFSIFITLPNNQKEQTTEYRAAIEILNEYFIPKRRAAVEIFKFNKLTQNSNESVEQYVSRL